MGGDLTQPDPPQVTKRKVRSILRQERERLGLTQKAAADRMLWSLSKLIRIETGAAHVSPADVRVLLREYGVAEERAAEVVRFAQESRNPDQWDQFKDVLSVAARNLFANEGAAGLTAKYEPEMVPGLFQTEPYARTLLGALYPPATVERRVEARLRRQGLLDADTCPELNVIIGETAVSRIVGGEGVMREQLARLKSLAERENITLQLMPFTAGAHEGMGSGFTVLQFKDVDLPDLVYLESVDKESTVREDQDEVTKYTVRFAMLREHASPPERFADELDQIARARFGGP